MGISLGDVSGASLTGNVAGNGMSYAVGGLVGGNRADQRSGVVSDSESNATVSGGASNLASIGGLVGVNRGGDILRSTSRGTTSGANIAGVNVGGLVGARRAQEPGAPKWAARMGRVLSPGTWVELIR